MGRSTGGVKAIHLPKGDRLVSMAWVRPEDGEATEGDEVDGDSPNGDTAPPSEATEGDTEQ